MSNKNYLMDNLNFLMETCDITANLLSKETGVGQATIYKIKDGEISNPTIDTILPLSKYFGFSIDELIRIKLYSTNPSANRMGNMIPLIPFNHINNFPNIPPIRYINTDCIDVEGKYCVEIVDDDCIFIKNSILIINTKIKYEKSDFVIVINNNNKIPSIKKIIFDDIFFLQSTVKSLYQHIYNINDYTVLGVVVGYIKYFKEP